MKAMFTCPICQKSVKDLKAHKARMHPAQTSETAADAENQETSQELEVDTSGVDTGSASAYHCVDCGGAVKKGQERCSCGASLDWSLIS